ncbi:Mucin-19 [Manis pentadactyla]|nr:Mucin-19 [Manis pentadactyla]
MLRWKRFCQHSEIMEQLHPLHKPIFEKHLSAGVPPFPGPGVTHPQSPGTPLPGGLPRVQTRIGQQPGLAGETRAAAGPGHMAVPAKPKSQYRAQLQKDEGSLEGAGENNSKYPWLSPAFRLYKELAWETGFEEFHLHLRPVPFESVPHKDKVDQQPPASVTSAGGQ